MLALATALEHLELTGLAGLDADAPAMLARLPALRRLGLPFAELKPCAGVLHALRQAYPNLSVYDCQQAAHCRRQLQEDDGSWEG